MVSHISGAQGNSKWWGERVPRSVYTSELVCARCVSPPVSPVLHVASFPEKLHSTRRVYCVFVVARLHPLSTSGSRPRCARLSCGRYFNSLLCVYLYSRRTIRSSGSSETLFLFSNILLSSLLSLLYGLRTRFLTVVAICELLHKDSPAQTSQSPRCGLAGISGMPFPHCMWPQAASRYTFDPAPWTQLTGGRSASGAAPCE